MMYIHEYNNVNTSLFCGNQNYWNINSNIKLYSIDNNL